MALRPLPSCSSQPKPRRRRPAMPSRLGLVFVALVLLLAVGCLPTLDARRPPNPQRRQQALANKNKINTHKKNTTRGRGRAYEPRHKALHRRYRKERQMQEQQQQWYSDSVVEERAMLSEPEPLTDDAPPPTPPPEDEDEDLNEEEEGEKDKEGASAADIEGEREERDLIDGAVEESSSSSSSSNDSSSSSNSSFPAVAVPTPDSMLYNGKGPLVVDGEDAAEEAMLLLMLEGEEEEGKEEGEEQGQGEEERDLVDEPCVEGSSSNDSSSSNNSNFPAVAYPTPDYILNNGKGPLVVDGGGEGGREGEAHLIKLMEETTGVADTAADTAAGGAAAADANGAAGDGSEKVEEEEEDDDDDEDDDQGDPDSSSSSSSNNKTTAEEGEKEGGEDEDPRWSYVSTLGSFFLIGASLVALAYHYSRRSSPMTMNGHHNAQPQFNMASPRITFASATHTPGNGAGGRGGAKGGGGGTPPQFHLEPTYVKRGGGGGGEEGRGRTGSFASSLPASSLSLSPAFSQGRRGSTTNPLQLQHLNHHNLAQGPPSSSSSSSAEAAAGGGGEKGVRGMSIYREAPCSACGLQPRTHALVPCSHLVCESCASTASFCAACKSAVVSKNWVMSPSR